MSRLIDLDTPGATNEPWKGGEGEGHVRTSDIPAHYREVVAPEISSTPVGLKTLDGNTSNIIVGALVTVNPGDDVTAATRLGNKYPEVSLVAPDDVFTIAASAAITDLYLVGIHSGTTAYTAGNAVGVDTTTAAAISPVMLHYTFDAADEVKAVVIRTGKEYTSSQKMLVQVQGISHA